jgi:hypothetical protein
VLVGGIRAGSDEIAVFVNCSSDVVAIEPVTTGALKLPPLGEWSVLEPFGVATVLCEGSSGGLGEPAGVS